MNPEQNPVPTDPPVGSQPNYNPQPMQNAQSVPPVTPVASPQLPPQQPYMTSLSTPSPVNKGLILALIGAVVLIVVGALLAWFMLLSPEAQAKKASNKFMTALTTDNKEKVYDLAEAKDDSTKEFLDSAVEASKGTFKLKEKAMKDGKGYFLYTLSNEDGKLGRTIVEKQNGKYVVSGYVFGSDNLALIPNEKEDAPTELLVESAQKSGTSSSSCLVDSDFDDWYLAMYNDGTATENGFRYSDPDRRYNTNIHFPADSLEYEGYDYGGAIEKITNLAKDPKVVNKQFVIRLRGSVGTSQADSDFANKRSEKVKEALIANGIPANKIAIDAPGSATDFTDNPNEVEKSRDRVVVLYFDPTCNASGSSR